MDRREFILGAAASAGLSGCMAQAAADGGRGRILFGACRGSFEDVRIMREVGYDFWESGAGAAFDPTKDDAWWRSRKDELRAYPLPLRSCNGFLPGRFRLTGPKADHAPALDYAETVLRRADELGTPFVVFGSGGARNAPGDMCGESGQRPDPERAAEQYADFCRALAARTRDLRTTTVVIEPLRPKETNVVNYVWQAAQIARDIDSPRIKVLADIFHMMMGREDALSLVRECALLLHCHIASFGTRDFPGAQPETVPRLKPYFNALRRIGYAGGVSCECGWGAKEDFRKNLAVALNTMKGLVS